LNSKIGLSFMKIISAILITITLLISIPLIDSGSSLIYAKKDPSSILNKPHDYNKFVCGTRADHSLHTRAILDHEINLKRLSNLQFSPSVSADFEDGDIAVMVDDGTLLIPPGSNTFDLDGLTLLFTPDINGFYDVDTVEFTFDASFGINLNAGDDTDHEFQFKAGFSFPFFDFTWTDIWIRSNGNVTFGSTGTPNFYAATDFSLQLPMIAALFGDLDPSSGGGVFAKEEATKFTVTWNAVPEFGVNNTNTLQLVLNDDGSFQITYNSIGMAAPVTGLFVGYNSGRAGATVQEIDFSSAFPIDGGNNDKLFELFTALIVFPKIDLIALFNKFYETHDDIFDQLVVYTNFTTQSSTVAGAFHFGISTSVLGINRPPVDNTSFFGSAGRLKSYLWMNQLSFWPSDPYSRVLNTGNSVLSILGQETGHRWNSFLRFDPGTGVSNLLLGRGLVHWSTYLGFEVSSTMDGGNNWEEIAPNTFENKSFVDYFSNLDQYTIGLRAPEEVPPFFYISSASNDILAARTPGTVFPGTQATGTRVEVTIEEVIAVEGPRIPARDSAQKDYHQAFILLVQQGTVPSNFQINQLQVYMDEWRKYWNVATDGRSTMSTNLSIELDVAAVEGLVKDASTDLPIKNILAVNLETGVNQSVAAGGYYTWRTLAESVGEPDGSFTQIISAYPYIPDTSVVPVTFNSTITQNINLTKLPTGSLEGTITNSGTGTPVVEALVVIEVFSDIIGAFEIEVSTDATGKYSFADLFVPHQGVISYEGLTIYPDFPGANFKVGEITVEDGITATMDIEVEVANILLVNDDPNGEYGHNFTNVLDNIKVTYNHWIIAEKGNAPAPAANSETTYPIIIWYSGDDTGNSISAEEEDSLITFLDAGGRLFLTGQNIIENLSPSSLLLTNYLQVSHGGNSTQVLATSIRGNQVFSGNNTFSISGTGGANNQISSDILNISGTAVGALIYGTSGANVAAVTVDDGNSKIFLTGFGFEGIVSDADNFTTPKQLMFNVLTWFGVTGLVSVDDELVSSLPKEFSLKQNYPNPFNPITTIEYELAKAGELQLIVYNVLGQEIARLVDGMKSAGKHIVIWDASKYSSGIYFYRLESENFRETRKLILLK